MSRIAPYFLALFTLAIPANASGDLQVDATFLPVSGTPYAENQFIMSDYKQVYLLSKDGGWRLKQIAIVPKTEEPLPFVLNRNWTTNYNPAGVHYDPDSKTLLIANYQGHDVLLAKLVGSPLRAEIFSRITHPELKSPENAYSRGGLIAVADYDGSAILLLREDGTLVWRRELSLAHGVLIANGSVYGTGLGTDKLVRWSLDGVETARGGRGLLYPTQITVDGAGNLAVIDANLGAVVTFDKDLRELDRHGRNGPKEADYFRPYGLVYGSGKRVVADTYKHRLVITAANERSTVTVQPTIAVGEALGYGAGPTPYCTKSDAPSYAMDAVRFAYGISSEISGRIGYQVFCLYQGEALFNAALMPFPLPSQRVPLGFAWVHNFPVGNRHVTILGDPGSAGMVVLDDVTGTFHRVALPVGLQIWSPDASIIPFIEGRAKLAVQRFDKVVDACDGNVLAAFVAVSGDSQSFEGRLAKLLRWKEKAALISEWKSGKPLAAALSGASTNGEAIWIEDALLLRLMDRNKPDATALAFKNCRETAKTAAGAN